MIATSKEGPPSPEGATRPGRASLASTGLYVCTFASGAAVMVYELLAIRILQRDFGGAIDVWASEIAVCMGGLAVGYSVGGRLADRYHSLRLLSAALFVGGLLGLFIERLALFAGEALLEVDAALAWHPLLAAGLSTFLPIAALGTVMPQAIRLHTARLDTVGKSVGWIATISTFGGIVGILLTAMVFLKYWGVLEILYAASAILMILALFTGLAVRKSSLGGSRGPLCALLILTLTPVAAQAQVRFETYSAYHHILVQDSGNTRTLFFDNDPQSLMALDNPLAGGFEYVDFFHLPIIFDPTTTKVLFLGLGGGTGPKSFLSIYPTMKVEVAEIDPTVVRVAKRFFALPQDPRLTIHEMDGRAYLRRARGPYGAILMDAYSSGPKGAYLPYHMATQEFFTLTWGKLDNGGSLFYNAIGVHGGLNAGLIQNLLVTLESVFQAVYVFQARTSINTIFVAVKIDPSTLEEDGTRDGRAWPEGPWLRHPLSARELTGIANEMGPAFNAAIPGIARRLTQFSRAYTARRRGFILTDNYAPVDVAPRRR